MQTHRAPTTYRWRSKILSYAFEILGSVHCLSLVLVRISVVQVDRIRFLAKPHVQDLDKYRERHREIDVALRYMLTEPFADERYTDQQQERKCQHLNRRMPLDERSD